jgi:hypothetical protein
MSRLNQNKKGFDLLLRKQYIDLCVNMKIDSLFGVVHFLEDRQSSVPEIFANSQLRILISWLITSKITN